MPASPPLRRAVIACLFWAGLNAVPVRAQFKVPPAAVEALAEGRYEHALSALNAAAPSAEVAYLKARVLAELSRHQDALAALGDVPASFPPGVRADIQDLRVKWTAETGRCAELEALLAGQADRESRRLLGRCFFAANDWARAKDLLGAESDPASRGMLVRCLAQLGDTANAVPLARSLYVSEPAHRDAAFLRELLSSETPHFTLSVEEHFTRAEALLKARRPEAVQEELAGLDKRTPKKLRAKLWHLRAEAFFRTRKNYEDAERAFAKAAALHGEDEAYDAFHAIRSASRAGKDKSAIKNYRAYARRYPDSPLTPDALYLSAWLGAREQSADARTALKRFVDSDAAKKAPGLKRDAVWDLAWLALERGDGPDAVHWLDECARQPNKQAMQAARIAYWHGRAALLMHDVPRAREQFKAALEVDRLGYYAQLAARRLIELGDPAPAPFDANAPVLTAPPLSPPAEVVFYRELGLASDAARAASAWIEGLSRREARVAALAFTEDAAETFSAAAPLMDQVLATSPDGETRWLWQALFPRPYLTSVDAATAQHDLPSALFYGHMQVESRYKPKAVSGADAIGLMQMLPSTASKVAEKTPYPSDRAALMRPYVNIGLSARYLAGLLKHYGGQYPLAIAAYNAGTQRVDGWSHKKVELDRWVERIPVEQTRNYVRRVLSAYSRYHAMEFPQAPWDIPIPEFVGLRTD